MCKIRIRKLDCGCFVIDECVIPSGSRHWAAGSYITWDGLYTTEETAQHQIDIAACEPQQEPIVRR